MPGDKLFSENPFQDIYLWQNGEKINVEKQIDCLTVHIDDPSQVELIAQLDGVLNVKQVFNNIYRLKTTESKLEFIMQTLRYGFNLVAHHAFYPSNTHHTRYYLTDNITVKFDEETTNKAKEQLLDRFGLRYVRSYDERTYMLQVTSSSLKNPIKVTNELATFREIEYAEPNLISRFSPSYLPLDHRFSEQWHLKSNGGPELSNDADVGVEKAWKISKGKREVVIAILDDGFDLTHPDLKGPGKVVFPKDFVNGTDYPMPGIGNFHGTPCAGIAIGEENGEGIVGVAPQCSFMPVRIPFGADPNLLFEIFDYVGKRAHVISCSWGPPPVYAPLHRLVFDKIEELTKTGGPDGKGCVIIFAAHNFNAPLNDPENKKGVRYLSGTRVYEHNDPILNGNATHPAVITVGACTSLNKKALYSNWGKEISLCAPSNNYNPLNLSEKLKGRGLCTTDNFEVGSYYAPNSRYTTQFGGTSGAAPIVAGVAGLMISVNPSLSAHEIKEILIQSADKITDNENDPIWQHNKGRYNSNGHSEWFGYGKVNALKAVEEAKKRFELTLASKTENGELEVESISTNSNLNVEGNEDSENEFKPTLIPVRIGKEQAIKFHKKYKGALKGKRDEQVFELTVGKRMVLSLSSKDENTDFDLFVKRNSKPSTSNHDYKAMSETSSERIEIDKLKPGTYYILVSSFKGKGEYELDVLLE